MKGQRVGYIRVSTIDQNPERQLDNVQVDRRFLDMASGKDIKRPEFESMMKYVRNGDTVVVHSMDRLARNLEDLRRIVRTLTSNCVCIEFIKENVKFSGDDSPMSILLLSMMGAFAEFERSLIKERQKEGIALAKKRGVYTGRKKCLTPERVLELKKRIEDCTNKSKLAREFGIGRQTLYQYLK